MRTPDLTSETNGLIRRIVSRELSGASIGDIETTVREDHAGDESIYIEIIYETPEPDADPKRIATLVLAMNDELNAAGESRFAYISNRGSQDASSFRLRACLRS